MDRQRYAIMQSIKERSRKRRQESNLFSNKIALSMLVGEVIDILSCEAFRVRDGRKVIIEAQTAKVLHVQHEDFLRIILPEQPNPHNVTNYIIHKNDVDYKVIADII